MLPRTDSEEAVNTMPYPGPGAVSVDAAGATSVGRERPRNEDQFLVATLERSLHLQSSSMGKDEWLPASAEGTLLVVADGMGGHGGGDVASRVAVKAVADCICTAIPWFIVNGGQRRREDSLPGVREGLSYAVEHGDREIRRVSKRGVGAPDMGTTLTMAYVAFPRAYVAHVGDSRCYLWDGSELRRLTRDHTVAEQLRERAGDMEPATPFEHVLWNALGGGATIQARPEVTRVELEVDDVLLLCSDGLTKHVDDANIANILAGASSAADACAQLVAAANAAGGTDNITAVVARFLARDFD